MAIPATIQRPRRWRRAPPRGLIKHPGTWSRAAGPANIRRLHPWQLALRPAGGLVTGPWPLSLRRADRLAASSTVEGPEPSGLVRRGRPHDRPANSFMAAATGLAAPSDATSPATVRLAHGANQAVLFVALSMAKGRQSRRLVHPAVASSTMTGRPSCRLVHR